MKRRGEIRLRCCSSGTSGIVSRSKNNMDFPLQEGIGEFSQVVRENGQKKESQRNQSHRAKRLLIQQKKGSDKERRMKKRIEDLQRKREWKKGGGDSRPTGLNKFHRRLGLVIGI